MNSSIFQYVNDNAQSEPEILKAIRLETEALPQGKMLSPWDQVAFIRFLIPMLNIQTALEVGTFTGYTTLGIAEVLPKNGHITTCDIKPEYTEIAEKYWAKSPHLSKITLKMGHALETLQSLVDEGFQTDLIFIDANKGDYAEYYELCLNLLSPNGLLLIDNTLWGGSVADPDNQENITRKLRAMNEKVRNDHRVTSHLLPIGDGLTLVKHNDCVSQ